MLVLIKEEVGGRGMERKGERGGGGDEVLGERVGETVFLCPRGRPIATSLSAIALDFEEREKFLSWSARYESRLDCILSNAHEYHRDSHMLVILFTIKIAFCKMVEKLKRC